MTDRTLFMRWYVVVNDLVGGWAIATVDKPLSAHYNEDEFEVAAFFMTEEAARHVVTMHNHTLARSTARR